MVVPVVSEPAWEGIVPQDVPEDDADFSIPDATASREERRSFLSYLNKPKNEDEKPSRSRPRKRKAPASRPKKGAFTEPLTEMYGFVGMAIFMRDQHCGTVVMENAEKCAEALDELAYQNESVRRVLDKLTTTSAFGAVVLAHAPIIAAIAAHHGGGRLPFVPRVVEDSETE